jgi:AraC-like DNA-binding protein
VKSVVTVSNALVLSIVEGAGVSDADKTRMLAEVGLSESVLRDITARTSIVVLARLWKRILRATGDDFIGLHIGTVIRGDRFGLAARAAVQGDDFRQTLLRFAKYATLINDLLEVRLEEHPPCAHLVARLHWNVLGLERHAIDIAFAAVVTFARVTLQAPLVVREVRVKHALSSARPGYETVFGAPIVFGADRSELVFDIDALDQPIAGRDPELGLILDRYASQELAKVPVVTDLPARVTQILQQLLRDGGDVELAGTATRVKMTPRSLQRRLRDHATSFSVLLDGARRVVAPELLAAADGNVEQVGFRLGYSEPTAFIRAFKKWYGQTPGAFRRAKPGA